MKVLFLMSRFPYPPDRGDRLTVFNLLKLFSTRHEVTLLSFVDGTEPPEAVQRVAEQCARVQTVHLSRMQSWLQAWAGLPLLEPSQNSYYHSGAMHDLVRSALAAERFDIVFTHCFRMAPYAAKLAHPGKVMYMGDSTGMMYKRSMRFAPWWKRPGLAWETWRVERYEVWSSKHFIENWALSAVDQQDLTRIGCHNVVLVPHGVDERLFGVTHEPAPEPRVMFLGNLSVPHNIDSAIFAARDILPLVRGPRPDVKLVLAGADPTPEVVQLGELPGVEVTGTVPDLLGLWRSASVMLAPLRFSGGIQNKILEAMAAGVPVVTTPGAAEAIGGVHGENLLVAQDAAGLARAVEELLADRPRAQRIARAAREHVRGHFSWQTMLDRLDHIGSASRRAPPAPAMAAAPGDARAV